MKNPIREKRVINQECLGFGSRHERCLQLNLREEFITAIRLVKTTSIDTKRLVIIISQKNVRDHFGDKK